jgi:hypothetical protein
VLGSPPEESGGVRAVNPEGVTGTLCYVTDRTYFRACVAHLFQHKRAHPVILDGNEIGTTTIGYKHDGDYFYYINGHTLEVSASKCVYKSLTYIDVIEPQETVWIQDMSVVGIAIHNFIDTSERVAPDNPRFHGQLEHVRDMLEQAVLRRVLDTPPDGEATLDRKHIDRGYAQFCAAMY